jgi:hypothetical protein
MSGPQMSSGAAAPSFATARVAFPATIGGADLGTVTPTSGVWVPILDGSVLNAGAPIVLTIPVVAGGRIYATLAWISANTGSPFAMRVRVTCAALSYDVPGTAIVVLGRVSATWELTGLAANSAYLVSAEVNLTGGNYTCNQATAYSAGAGGTGHEIKLTATSYAS